MSAYELFATLPSPTLPLAACATSPPDPLSPFASSAVTFAPSPSTSCDALDARDEAQATFEGAFDAPAFDDDALKLLQAYSNALDNAVIRPAGLANLPLDDRHAGRPAAVTPAEVPFPPLDSALRRAPIPSSLISLLTPTAAPTPSASTSASPSTALARARAPGRAPRAAPAKHSTAGLLDRLAESPQRKVAPGPAAAAWTPSTTPTPGSAHTGTPLKRSRNDVGSEDDEQPPRAIKIVKVVSPSSLGIDKSPRSHPAPTPRARACPPKPKQAHDRSNAYDGSTLYKSPTDSQPKRSRSKKTKRAALPPTSSVPKAAASTAVSRAQAHPEPMNTCGTVLSASHTPCAALAAHMPAAPTAPTTTLDAHQDFDAAAFLALLDTCPVLTPTHPLDTSSSAIAMQAPVAHPSLDNWSTSPLSTLPSHDYSPSHDASRSSSIGSSSSFWSTMSGSSSYSAHSSVYSSPPLPLFLAEGASASAFEGYSLGSSAGTQHEYAQPCSLQVEQPLGYLLAPEQQPATLGAPFFLGDIPVGSAADYEYTPAPSPSPSPSPSQALYPSAYEYA